MGAVLLGLLLLQLEPVSPTGPIFSGPATSSSLAFFEFAPLGGAGMGTVCACASVTGAKGETLTFSRSSSATCLKGGTTSAIANGDMVTCGSGNRPRVMPGGDGSGGLGVLIEGPRTNSFLRSEEFDNASWSTNGTTPVVTADQATAPDTNATADQVVFAATTTGQRSVLYQVAGFNGAGSLSVFARGTATTPTGAFDVCASNTKCVSCSYVSTSWTRCASENATIVSGGTTPFIGNDTNDNGGTARSAQTVYLWGAQFEAGAFASSYIATTSAGVTRATETASFVFSAWSSATASLALTWVTPSVLTGTPIPFLFQTTGDAAKNFYGNYNTGKWRSVISNGTTTTNSTAAGMTAGAANRVVAIVDATPAVNACLAGVCETPAASAAVNAAASTLYPGRFAGSDTADGVVKQVCLDPSASRCR